MRQGFVEGRKMMVGDSERVLLWSWRLYPLITGKDLQPTYCMEKGKAKEILLILDLSK